MTQLEKLKRGLETLGIKYYEQERYKAYGVRVQVVVWKGKDGRINEAEQTAHSTIMRVSTNSIMSAEEAIAITIGNSMKVNHIDGSNTGA